MPVSAADLPEELIHLIVDFLSGQYLSNFPEEAKYMPSDRPLRLTKRQLGACSLTCRHWAAHVRHQIFYELTLRSHEDARMLLAFARPPTASSRFGIAQYVQGLKLSIDLADVPWAYLIYTFSYLFPNMDEGALQLSVRGPSQDAAVCFSSIHHAAPKTLPASLSVSYGLLVEDVRFEQAADLVALLRSVHNPPADTQPRSFLGRLPAGYYKFRRVSFAHATTKRVPLQRLWVDDLGVLDLYMAGCPAPWAFLRPFVVTRAPATLARVPTHAWVPHLRAHELELVEHLLRAIALHNCGCAREGEPEAEVAAGHDVFHLQMQPGSLFAPDGFRATLRSGCLRTCWRDVDVTVASAGVVRELRVVLSEHMAFVPACWAALDDAAAPFGQEMRAVVVQFEDSVGPCAARDLARDIEAHMPLVRAASKLQFWRRVTKTRPLVYVKYDADECAESKGEENQERKPLDIMSRANFYF